MDIQCVYLERILNNLSEEDLKSFNKIFTKLFFDAYRWDLWGAAFVIGGGCSDDSFMDFRSWLISMGKEVYETGMQNPDELVSAATDPTVEDCFFEDFQYVADNIYEEKYDSEFDLDIVHPKEPVGAPWEESDLDSLFPKLTEQFG
jgi:hypothetical protein